MERPKVGDKVRIMQDLQSIGLIGYEGQTAEIVGIDYKDDKQPYYVETEDGQRWWAYKTDVELIEEGKTTSPKRKLDVGDKVRVKSRKWYEKNKDINGYVKFSCTFVPSMVQYCGRVMEIEEIFDDINYRCKGNTWCWSREMFDLDESTSLSSPGIITQMAHAVGSIFGSTKPTITSNLPLIKTNKLLTNIKLD